MRSRDRIRIMGRGLFLAIVALATIPASAGTLSGPARVIDGDTLAFGEVVVRLNGIDAAELGQKCDRFSGGDWACADAAAERLEALVSGGNVGCEALDTDFYGRVIATCRAGGVDVGRQLVKEGLAWAFVKYDTVYADDEATAKAAGLGIWQGAPRDALGLSGRPLGTRRARGSPVRAVRSRATSTRRACGSITRPGRLGTAARRSPRARANAGSATRPRR